MRSQVSLGDVLAMVTRIPGALKRRSQERRHRKMMRTAPVYSVATLPENTFGKVTGIARPAAKRLIEAPLSGRLCVYYEVYVDATSSGLMLRTIASEQEGIAFVLADGETRAMIDPANAMMSTGIDRVERSTLYLASERQQAILHRHNLVGKVLAGKMLRDADGLRYREAIIEADEKIAVFGGGVREPDPETTGDSYRGDGAPTRLCLSGSERFPLFISDDPRVL